MFRYHAANEESYTGNVTKANIALLDNSKGRSAETRGWFRFLTEKHFLFALPQIDTALDSSWQRYEAIILPDLQPLSDALASKLDAFVADGGTLIAANRAGFYDEHYELRELPARLFHRHSHTNTIDFTANLIEHVAGQARWSSQPGDRKFTDL